MKIPKINECPNCNEPVNPSPQDSNGLSVHCESCGFLASTVDVQQADYLANFYRLPDVSVMAQRISDRSMLEYSSAKSK